MRRLKNDYVHQCRKQSVKLGWFALVLLQSHWKRLQVYGKLCNQLWLKIHGPVGFIDPLNWIFWAKKCKYGFTKKKINKVRRTACYMSCRRHSINNRKTCATLECSGQPRHRTPSLTSHLGSSSGRRRAQTHRPDQQRWANAVNRMTSWSHSCPLRSGCPSGVDKCTHKKKDLKKKKELYLTDSERHTSTGSSVQGAVFTSGFSFNLQ